MKPPRALGDVNSIPNRAEMGAQHVKGFFLWLQTSLEAPLPSGYGQLVWEQQPQHLRGERGGRWYPGT